MSDNTQTMTNRRRVMAVLQYEDYDRLPLCHFGFWFETLHKWADEGHLTREEAEQWFDGGPADVSIGRKLGFDCNYYSCFHPSVRLHPPFERKLLRELEDGSKHVLSHNGVIELEKPGAGSIPAEIDYTLKDRASWEEHYKWRYEWTPERVHLGQVLVGEKMVPFDEGGLEFLKSGERDYHYGLHCGSLFGQIRDVLGVENASLMPMMDPELFDEIVETVVGMQYRTVEYALETGAQFDFGHFWEDICFKNGPLINPPLFHEKFGPHYRRFAELLGRHGIEIVSLDCDGLIDHLIPTWIENGVNTMFPIEVGTWDASIAPWRAEYGRALRGVGGMNKTVFAKDRAAIDAEVERLRPLVELGGYLPCPDHRIAPDARWELVQYYCERMHEIFG